MAKEPKQTKMSAEAEAQAEAERRERLAARTYVLKDDAWKNDPSPEYGGQSEILEMEVGEVVGPFKYTGHQAMTTALGDTTVHLATTRDGEQVRLPISATFVRAVDQAGLIRDDEFLIKRFEDIEKKRGKGAGNMMPIYAVKVTKRAPRLTA